MCCKCSFMLSLMRSLSKAVVTQRRDIKQQIYVCDLLFSVSHGGHEQQALLLWDRGKPPVCVSVHSECVCVRVFVFCLLIQHAKSLWWMLVSVWVKEKEKSKNECVFYLIFTHHLFIRVPVNCRHTNVAMSLTPPTSPKGRSYYANRLFHRSFTLPSM